MMLCRSQRFLATSGADTSCRLERAASRPPAEGLSGEDTPDKAAASGVGVKSASEEPRFCAGNAAIVGSSDTRRVFLCFPLECRRFLCFRESGAPPLRPEAPGWSSRLARLDDDVRVETDEELEEREREARTSDGRGDLTFAAFDAPGLPICVPAPARE